MPQVFQVLKCYKCLVFQVHQTKKSNKFQCKMCGEKQSMKRHYGIGNGLECRKHVQKLNSLRGEIDESKNISDECSEDENMVTRIAPTKAGNNCQTKKSKWSNFIDKEEDLDAPSSSNDNMYLNDNKVVLELPQRRQKMLGRYTKNKKHRMSSLNNSDPCGDDDPTVEQSKQKLYSVNIIKQSPPNDMHDNHNSKQSIVLTEQGNCLINHNIIPKHKSHINQECVNVIGTKDISSPNPTKNIPKFVAPRINMNSKWAKFADGNDDDISLENGESDIFFSEETNQEYKVDNESESIPEECSTANIGNYSDIVVDHCQRTHKIFSLCDDSDIDSYLAI